MAGFAKTRLIPALGAQGAADLAHRLLTFSVHNALKAKVGPIELCVTPATIAGDNQILAIEFDETVRIWLAKRLCNTKAHQ